MDKKLLRLELLGLAFTAAGAYFMHGLYAATDRGLIGILFGCVNDSIWESCKTLLLPYLLWAMLELLCLGGRMRRFTVAKTVSLILLVVLFLSLCALYHTIGGTSWQTAELLFAAVSVMCAFALSYFLMRSALNLSELFPPALFLLFLLMALYFSLTPFPMKNFLFKDPTTGMYGILPRDLDYGAIALDTMYFFRG